MLLSCYRILVTILSESKINSYRFSLFPGIFSSRKNKKKGFIHSFIFPSPMNFRLNNSSKNKREREREREYNFVEVVAIYRFGDCPCCFRFWWSSSCFIIPLKSLRYVSRCPGGILIRYCNSSVVKLSDNSNNVPKTVLQDAMQVSTKHRWEMCEKLIDWLVCVNFKLLCNAT